MVSFSRALFWGLFGLSLAACTDPGAINRNVSIGGEPALATNADLRLVTVRPNPLGQVSESRRILCTEPTPDIAKALSTALSLAASAKTPSGIDASANVSHTTAEQVTALAGRTAAVVALRDGLYKACEAYANGVIGDSAYALIISRYGDLLVTLMLGEAAATAPASSGSGQMSAAEAIFHIQQDFSAQAASSGLAEALFVGCLTEFDPTRPVSNGKSNPVLSQAACTNFINAIVETSAKALAAPTPPRALNRTK